MSPDYDKEKVEVLEAELECLQKENEALGLMFETMSRKYIMLHQAYLRQKSNKRQRLEVPDAAGSKASQVFVKTDPRDQSLVQRCVEDKSIVVATYEGQHNHDVDSTAAGKSMLASCSSAIFSGSRSIPFPPLDNPFPPPITLDLTLSGSDLQNHRNLPSFMHDYSTSNDDGNNKKKKIEDYVASLTKDPNFTLALAAAVARSIKTEHPKPSPP
ncbi:hypothetical protein ES332_A05G064600v1 [Gossypium tomentosum]|uniref:WRKY domain-containing protein n=1 Tax=Gossypium tomentosum TaxID=34277 RepID=A0A5D2QEE3_GOSTO|nr:hypothetical protein ES332_A05G064600v1 [Gossypium tomentosum]